MEVRRTEESCTTFFVLFYVCTPGKRRYDMLPPRRRSVDEVVIFGLLADVRRLNYTLDTSPGGNTVSRWIRRDPNAANCV